MRFFGNFYNISRTLIFEILRSSVTIRSGIIGDDGYMDLFDTLNGASRVPHFEIGRKKIIYFLMVKDC